VVLVVVGVDDETRWVSLEVFCQLECCVACTCVYEQAVDEIGRDPVERLAFDLEARLYPNDFFEFRYFDNFGFPPIRLPIS